MNNKNSIFESCRLKTKYPLKEMRQFIEEAQMGLKTINLLFQSRCLYLFFTLDARVKRQKMLG